MAYALLRAARLRESPECLVAAKKFLDPWRGRVVQQAPWILVLGLILEHPFLELTLGQVASWCYCVRFMCLYLVKTVNDV